MIMFYGGVHGHTCSMTLIEIQMPEPTHRPDVQFRMQEFVRVLNASEVIKCATQWSGDDFAMTFGNTYALDKPGPKFTRVVRKGSQTMVVCFIENETGKVVKSAGWKAPAKDKDGLAYRYDLMDKESRDALYALGVNATYYKD